MSREALAEEHAQLTAGLTPRYQVHERLGEGACGIVWAATRAEDGRRVAIKFLRSQMSTAPGVRQRFDREIEILGRMAHPHVMELVEAGQLGERPFLIMPRVEGSDLDEVLKLGPVEPARAMKWLAQVATAVETAHSMGVIHRDLKPANVLITGDDRALVTDFGLASGAGFEELTKTGTFVGTPLYMAPEQFMGAAPEASMDVYALASMAYRIFEGKEPFQAPDLGALVTAKCFPPETAPGTAAAGGPALEDLVLQALADEPAERPQMIELRVQLARRVADTVRLPPPPKAPPPPKPAPRPTRPPPDVVPGSGTASGAHPLGTSQLGGTYTGPPEDRGQVVRRSLAVLVGLALVGVGFFLPGGQKDPEVAAPKGPPPVPAYVLGLDLGGLELRFLEPVGRPIVVRVATPDGDTRRVDLGPDDDLADIAWAEFFPDSFTVTLEGEAGGTLREETRSLAIQTLEAPRDSSTWGQVLLGRGDEAWISRGAGGFDRLRPDNGTLTSAGAVDPTGGWGRVYWPSRKDGGGFLALAFEPGRQVLLTAGPTGAVAQLEIPGNLPRASRPVEVGRGKVLLVAGSRGGRQEGQVVGKLLDRESGVLTDVPFPAGFAPHRAPVRTTENFVFVLLRKGTDQGRLEVLRWEGGRLVPHASLVGDGKVVDEDNVADSWRVHQALGTVPARDLGVFWLGFDLLRVSAAEVPPGVHQLNQGIPPGVVVTSMGDVLSRASGDSYFVVEGTTLTSASMGRIPGSAPTMQMEEFVMTRVDLGDPASEPEVFLRHSRSEGASHMGTWAGKCRLLRDPYSGHWLATYETDRYGNNLLLVDDAGEVHYWRLTHKDGRWGRALPLRVSGGVFLGVPEDSLWYLPLWTHPRKDGS